MVFEDLHEFNGSSCEYPVCNESISTWKAALSKVFDGAKVDNAAGICSGGEVAFFSILPYVRKKLTVIDHAYGALYYAIGKYHLVEKYGSVKAAQMLKSVSDVGHESLQAVFKEANADLPTKPSKYVGNGAAGGRGRMTAIYSDISRKDIVKFRENRNKIHFLHGDLDDLAERGPFDLLYLSNALDYVGRTLHTPDKMLECVKPGGYILFTQGWRGMPKGLDNCKALIDAKPEAEYVTDRWGYRHRAPSSYGQSWHHHIIQTPA